ncbi:MULTISPECIES: methyl-accepting chemotaxis protein [Pantoea]|uniref:methyl-accepting chemotaxis protein n=1 Tax=Pantoea TaxID=53335 RepID=UPI000DA65961|nr:methyl-accepting chemotaxis protein [Pantoea ananatis]PZD65075.1 methyl-accepting chemotaxis protein [Pantoea ananatis]
MTITQRLFLTFSLLSASMIAMVVIVIMVLSGFQSRFQYVQTNTLPSLVDLDKMVNGSNRLNVSLYRHLSAKDQNKQAEFEKEITTRLDNVKALTEFYLKNETTNDQDIRLSQNALALIKQMEERLPGFMANSRLHSDAALADLQGNSGVGQSIRDLIESYQKQLQFNVEVGAAFEKDNNQVYRQTLVWLIAGSAAIILLLGAFSVRTILGIRRHLNGMRITMEHASERLDLTLRADDSRQDEIGLTAKAFNNLIGNVAHSLSSVERSAHSVSSATSQISAGNEDLSSRTEQQAASLEQTAASMSELSETVRQTAENTRLASQLSKNVRDISDDSATKVHTMLGTMTDIKQSSEKITAIISLIEGVAFQTNILALNAAVEAARAGEQGRGFAVVAGEVRNLAQRSSTSAREIKELIESSMRYVETGVNQAEQVGDNIGRMKDAVRQVTDLVDEIAVASQEQSLGIGQVHQAVNQMDDVTQQNAALVEEASSASRSLMDQASALNQLVATFVLTDAAPVAPSSPARVSSAFVQAPAAYAKQDDNWQHF